MGSHIWYVGEYSVAPGKSQTFKDVIEGAIKTELSERESVLSYEFFFNDDQSKFYAIELFRDSEAVLSHLERAKETIPKVLEVAEITRFEIYGTPSAALREAMSSFGAKMFGYWAGFTRLLEDAG